MIQHRTLTISGYEKRLIKYFKKFYDGGLMYGVTTAYLKRIWELDDVGKKRVQTAINRLCKRGIILRRIIRGKVSRGLYIYNPNYVSKSQKI